MKEVIRIWNVLGNLTRFKILEILLKLPLEDRYLRNVQRIFEDEYREKIYTNIIANTFNKLNEIKFIRIIKSKNRRLAYINNDIINNFLKDQAIFFLKYESIQKSNIENLHELIKSNLSSSRLNGSIIRFLDENLQSPFKNLNIKSLQEFGILKHNILNHTEDVYKKEIK